MSEQEQQRKIRHRLAVLRHAQEVTGSVSKTCRYDGISRPTFDKWLHRCEEHGEQGLRDGSSRPLNCPNTTRAEVVATIIYLRQQYDFGPLEIAMYFKRDHDIEISDSGVWRILKRLEMNRLPSSQRHKRHRDRWKRYEQPPPGHQVQVDVKFIESIAGSTRKYYQYTAIDDCTRIRVLRVYPRNDQETAIQITGNETQSCYSIPTWPDHSQCVTPGDGQAGAD